MIDAYAIDSFCTFVVFISTLLPVYLLGTGTV